MSCRLLRPRRLSVVVLVAGALGISCATAPESEPSSATVWGYVELVPKSGAESAGAGYGDRRLAHVKRVDYSHTTFAVVFAPTATDTSPSSTELVIREGASGPRVDPRFAYTTPTSGLRVKNATAEDRVISMPRAGHLLRIAPGESARIEGLSEGESSLHLLGLPDGSAGTEAQIWVTTGVAAEVEASGRYVLRGLEPGHHELRAWHPRLPPSPAHSVELARGSVQRVDIEIGVDAASSDDSKAL